MEGHDGQKILVYKKRDVEITNIEMVGNYAVRISFSDKHDTGIFTWKYLYDLGENKFTLSKQYLKLLKQHNKSR